MSEPVELPVASQQDRIDFVLTVLRNPSASTAIERLSAYHVSRDLFNELRDFVADEKVLGKHAEFSVASQRAYRANIENAYKEGYYAGYARKDAIPCAGESYDRSEAKKFTER